MCSIVRGPPRHETLFRFMKPCSVRGGGEGKGSLPNIGLAVEDGCGGVPGQQGGGSGRGSLTGQATSAEEGKLPWTSSLAEEALGNATYLSPAGKRQAARLINLLTAYAVLDPETGYCQGCASPKPPPPPLPVAPAAFCFPRLGRPSMSSLCLPPAPLCLQLQLQFAVAAAVAAVLYCCTAFAAHCTAATTFTNENNPQLKITYNVMNAGHFLHLLQVPCCTAVQLLLLPVLFYHDQEPLPSRRAETWNWLGTRMSDVAAPFLLVFDEDALAFTCFRCLMRHLRRNFLRDQSGIRCAAVARPLSKRTLVPRT